MRSLFVKGLMSATLFRLGVGSIRGLMSGSPDGWPELIFSLACVLALPLAFLLFTDSRVVARIALIVLAAAAVLQVATVLLALATHQQPPVRWSTELELALVYAFPCVVAFVVDKRDANMRSNQSLEPTASRSDV